MEVVTGESTLDQLDTADLDDAVSLRGFQAGCLGIQYDLSHHFRLDVSPRLPSSRAIPWFATVHRRFVFGCRHGPLTQCQRPGGVPPLSSSIRQVVVLDRLLLQRYASRCASSCGSTCVMPFFTYCESVVTSTTQERLSARSPRSPPSVPCGYWSSPRRRRTTPFSVPLKRSTAPQPPGPGLPLRHRRYRALRVQTSLTSRAVGSIARGPSTRRRDQCWRTGVTRETRLTARTT